MIAVLVKVDFSSGHRAGGINPRKNVAMPVPGGWQNTTDGWEIRICTTPESEQYVRGLIDAGCEGLTMLESDAELDAALDEFILKPEQPRYTIFAESIAAEYIRARGVDVAVLAGAQTPDELAARLHSIGVPGVSRMDPPKRPRAKDIRERLELVDRQRRQAQSAKAVIKGRKNGRAN